MKNRETRNAGSHFGLSHTSVPGDNEVRNSQHLHRNAGPSVIFALQGKRWIWAPEARPCDSPPRVRVCDRLTAQRRNPYFPMQSARLTNTPPLRLKPHKCACVFSLTQACLGLKLLPRTITRCACHTCEREVTPPRP